MAAGEEQPAESPAHLSNGFLDVTEEEGGVTWISRPGETG